MPNTNFKDELVERIKSLISVCSPEHDGVIISKYKSLLMDIENLSNKGFVVAKIEVLNESVSRAVRFDRGVDKTDITILHSEEVRNNSAYSSTYVKYLAHKELNVLDRNGNEVYESASGTKYTMIFTPGSPSSYGHVRIAMPSI